MEAFEPGSPKVSGGQNFSYGQIIDQANTRSNLLHPHDIGGDPNGMGNKGSKREAADGISISGLKQRHLHKLFERKKSQDTRSTRTSQSEISRTDTESTLRDKDSQSTIRGVSSPSASTPTEHCPSITGPIDGGKDDLPPSLGSTTQLSRASGITEEEGWMPQRADPLELAVTISDSSTPKPILESEIQQKNGFSSHSRSRSVPFPRSQIASAMCWGDIILHRCGHFHLDSWRYCVDRMNEGVQENEMEKTTLPFRRCFQINSTSRLDNPWYCLGCLNSRLRDIAEWNDVLQTQFQSAKEMWRALNRIANRGGPWSPELQRLWQAEIEVLARVSWQHDSVTKDMVEQLRLECQIMR
ncbi:MAG: hypothetical protein M1812_000171 [Candelaria pacifica]|nr:MAG: hypothetical protein M1812_000171 [Candelaria pacifica]